MDDARPYGNEIEAGLEPIRGGLCDPKLSSLGGSLHLDVCETVVYDSALSALAIFLVPILAPRLLRKEPTFIVRGLVRKRGPNLARLSPT